MLVQETRGTADDLRAAAARYNTSHVGLYSATQGGTQGGLLTLIRHDFLRQAGADVARIHLQDIVPDRILPVDIPMVDGSVAAIVNIHSYDVDADGRRALGAAVRERTTRAARETAYKSLVVVAGDFNYC